MLSAVYRTGQIFGGVHIVNVLRGEATELARKHGHDKLTVFGIGNDRSANFWRGAIRQLIARGALDTGSGEFASLSLVQEVARPLLRGEQRILLREEAAPALRRKADPAGVLRAALPAADADRFAALRAWRAREAQTQRVPAYVIFHDAVLADIASSRPRSRHDLAQIKGVGASKLERYADGLLQALG